MRAEPPAKLLRCAIYTRVSTEHGLEQDFNSLQAQREASKAYIKSQAHEGWRLIPDAYDDGGFSGGSLERPALQKLLHAVEEGRIDIVVVYKVDRLTRSLADFARLVDAFDKRNVSFVSVTQSFNTTSSMGRLTLNVLLSFAQFEREVTGERIRDKIAASKRKGIWMGGTVPFGDRVDKRKLLVDAIEAETVRLIFQRYLEVGSLPALQLDLKRRGLLTRARPLSSRAVRGGIAFTTGPLSQMLRNRIYIGEIPHKGRSWPGEHPAIIAADLFAAVQERLSQNLRAHRTKLRSSEALLMGRIYDDRGNRMTPAHARKGSARYRYYVCSAIAKGRAEQAGSVRRIPAPDVERVVIEALRTHASERLRSARLRGQQTNDPAKAMAVLDDHQLVEALVDRVVVGGGKLVIELSHGASSSDGPAGDEGAPLEDEHASQRAGRCIKIAWSPPIARRRRGMIQPDNPQPENLRPMRDGVRANLLQAIARARLWLDRLLSGEAESIEAIAAGEGCTVRSARQTLSLAFLSPTILQAVVDGQLPRGIALARLAELPSEWHRQHELIGIVGGPQVGAAA